MAAVGNNEEIEMAWAEQAFFHTQRFAKQMALRQQRPELGPVELSAQDDEVYLRFREAFPTLDIQRLDRAAQSEEVWRSLLESYKLMGLPDYNIGTLIRIDAALGFDQDNVFVGPRGIFVALEVARQREGLRLAGQWQYEEVPDEPTPLQSRAEHLLRQAAPKAGYVDIKGAPTCGGCKRSQQQDGKPLLKCSRCKAAFYCSVACQRNEWASHKPKCVPR